MSREGFGPLRPGASRYADYERVPEHCECGCGTPHPAVSIGDTWLANAHHRIHLGRRMLARPIPTDTGPPKERATYAHCRFAGEHGGRMAYRIRDPKTGRVLTAWCQAHEDAHAEAIEALRTRWARGGASAMWDELRGGGD